MSRPSSSAARISRKSASIRSGTDTERTAGPNASRPLRAASAKRSGEATIRAMRGLSWRIAQLSASSPRSFTAAGSAPRSRRICGDALASLARRHHQRATSRWSSARSRRRRARGAPAPPPRGRRTRRSGAPTTRGPRRLICAPRSRSQRTASRRPRQAANSSACSCESLALFTSAPRLTKSSSSGGCLPTRRSSARCRCDRRGSSGRGLRRATRARREMSPASIAAPNRTGSGSSARAAAARQSRGEQRGQPREGTIYVHLVNLPVASKALIVAKSCVIVKVRVV